MKKTAALIIVLCLAIAFVLSACGDGSSDTICYWCGKRETCYMYTMQSLNGYNPDGSLKLKHEIKWMSPTCADKCAKSGKYTIVRRTE